ncbi:hypothetical protein MgSA37_02411 [Mucilaginibacter gotjawali]|uniref:Uncharacterized protein n=2 Tax=Mucilaginibacter gotjawali TaxID=1550579 RepID=A0A839S9D1_9SPHI|nr:hypothetical protein [Mucilaginibacter gotjawali]BAU54237.1 hypothetical protein MgSA37_02411 [Mucilaginibacter gotjawali]
MILIRDQKHKFDPGFFILTLVNNPINGIAATPMPLFFKIVTFAKNL